MSDDDRHKPDLRSVRRYAVPDVPARRQLPVLTVRWVELDDALLDEAEDLVERNLPRPGLIIAHTAVEVAMSRALNALLAQSGTPAQVGDAVIDMVGTYGLMQKRVQTLWSSLTGERITSAPDWTAYRASVELRNEAVHHGRVVSVREALQGVMRSRDMVLHLRQTLDRLGVPTRRGPEPPPDA